MTVARTFARTQTSREVAAWRHSRALALYEAALAEYADAQTALSERLLAGEFTTPEEALREETARQKLENARTLVWAFPG